MTLRTRMAGVGVGIAQAVIAAAVATVLVALLLALIGKPPWLIIRTLVEGALDPQGYRVADALGRSCPLMLCGLAVAVAFRAQAWNIGVEGQYLCGAIACTTIGVTCTAWPAPLLVPVMLLAATLGGLLFAIPAVVLEQRRRVPLVLSTILLNFVAAGLVKYLTQGPLRGSDPSAAQSDPIAPQAYLGALMPRTDLHWGFLLAVAAAVGTWVLLSYSRAGFALRVSGLNPVAAEWAGIHVKRVTFRVMCLSGALGGLAGGIQVAGVYHLLNIQASEGFGYVGIAVALLGRLNPLGIVLAAVAIGLLDVGASHLERQAELGVPADLSQVIKGVLVLTVLVFSGGRVRRWVRWR